MASEKPTKTVPAKGKIVDKWKMKSWYTVLAPEMFDSRKIGEIVATEESTIPHRIIKVGLSEITGTFGQANAYTSLFFRVDKISGKSAHTRLVGHAIAPAYVQALVRRRRSVLNEVVDVVSRDGRNVRVKLVVLTGNKTSEVVRKALRHAVVEETKRASKELDFSQLMQEFIFGKFAGRVFGKVKKIAPVRRIEIRKSEVEEVFQAEKQ